MTTESYKFFIEHAYNQFVTHSAFHTSARAKTKAKDITGHGITHVSTKLSGYVWIGSKTKLVHIPEDQADDVTMDDAAEDDIDRTWQMHCQTWRLGLNEKMHKNLNKLKTFKRKSNKNPWKV